MKKDSIKNPGYLSSLLKLKCPRCRTGDMFLTKSYSRHLMKMRDNCEVCGQPMEIEIGFYYGTSYVSYIITVILSGISFAAWWLLIGFSYSDDRFTYWIISNAVGLLALQPYLMRFSRTLWLSLFVRYKRGDIFSS
jgi:uncharacterized protein (DUF983 family)